MMKKLLVLTLVLGLTSLASASLDLDIEVGGIDYAGEVLPPGTVVVKIVQSEPNPNGSGGEIMVNFDGANPTITDNTPMFHWQGYPYGGWDWFFNGGVSMINNGGGNYDAYACKIATDTSAWGMNGTPGIGSWVGYSPYGGWAYADTYKFTFQFTKTTDITFKGTWDGVDYTGVHETIAIIPEPMTIALLGLGGLLLRRRR